MISAALLGMIVAAPAVAQEVVKLRPGAVLNVRIVPGQPHSYGVQLRSGESAELVVQQDGVDVAVDVRDPGGRLLDSIDSPNGRSGPEPVSVIAGCAGSAEFMLGTPRRQVRTSLIGLPSRSTGSSIFRPS
jgi:hypothetical protein